MAKLSAHGRTEVLRLQRLHPPENLFSDTGEIGPMIRTELALMSDNIVLRKITWIYVGGQRHDTGWKAIGRLKPTQTVDTFREAYTTREPKFEVVR